MFIPLAAYLLQKERGIQKGQGGGGGGGRGCSNPGGNCGIQAIKTVTILLTNIWCLDE